jgi:hypothetical protein
MKMLHDAGMPAILKQRVQSLRPDTQHKWGSMTVDQMMWHVNVPLRECMGEYTAPQKPGGMMGNVLLWLVLRVPWGRSAPTRPDMVVKEHYDFEEQRTRCLSLIDRFATKDLSGTFPPSGNFGPMSGVKWSRLQAKHLDHHLRQFGA